MPLAQLLDRLQVPGIGQREAVGRGDRLHDHRGRVAGLQRGGHRVDVVERHVHELVRPVREEQLGEPVVAGADGEAGVAVVGLDDRHDLAALGRVPRRLDGDVDGLAAAAAVHDLGEPGRCGGDERLGQRGARAGREVMVADVERPHADGEGLDQLGVAVTEAEGAAVQVDVDQPGAGHVPDEVAFPPVDDEVDARLGPEIGLPRVPELAGLIQDLGLGPDREDVVVVHSHALVSRPPAVSRSKSHPARDIRPNHLSVRPMSQEGT